MSAPDIDFKLRGRYQLRRVKAVTGEIVEETPWSDNLITASGIDSLFLNTTISLCAVVGSGNTAPAAGNTRLASFLAGTTTIQAFVNSTQYTTAPYYILQSKTFRFAEGVAAGNISECGIALTGTPSQANSVNLFSRALIKDGAGNPTSVTVLADEFLDLVWEYYTYIPYGLTGTFSQVIDGATVSFSYTLGVTYLSTTTESSAAQGQPYVSSSNLLRGISVFTHINNRPTYVSPDAALPGPGGQLSMAATSQNADVSASAAYVTGAGYRDFTYTWNLNYGNITFRSIQFSSYAFAWAIAFSPSITKINTKKYTYTYRVTASNY